MERPTPELGSKESRESKTRFFLYIDVLNFSNLISQKGKVEELYEIINKLNVHHHDVFRTIIFSDTILVYNEQGARSLHDVHYLVMFLCEFAQDLFYRLVGKDIHFRAYITHGEFAHYSVEHIQSVFYGDALVESYLAEKQIKCTGLFMSNEVVPYSNIFKTTRFNEQCHFVFIMQSLGRMSFPKQAYPLDPFLITATDEIWLLAYDIRYLQTIHRHKNDVTLAAPVRKKYQTTWRMLMKRHKGFMTTLEDHAFDPNAISRCDWTEACARVGTARGFFG